jgi:hypothetical protein
MEGRALPGAYSYHSTEHRLKVFQNRVLTRITGNRREEVTGGENYIISFRI